VRKLKERDCYQDPGINGKKVLKWKVKKHNWKASTGFIWLKIGTSVGGCCEYGDEPSGSRK
jgi:hypothetical protein